MLRNVPDAAAGLAFERDLFDAVGPQVGLWTAAQDGLVCPGAYQKRTGFDEAARRSAERGWPVHLRPTGGGTVPQGHGIDNIALAFNAPEAMTIDDVYRLLTRTIQEGLGPAARSLETGAIANSFCDGAWNLAYGGRKLVGTAQRWRPRRGTTARVLAHALILTKDTFQEGAEAVAAFHKDLGLSPVDPAVHISLEEAIGVTELPVKVIRQITIEELSRL